ncbi:MAG: hypothetical protein GW939_00190, partial [Candidatus Magasanikbacteria bacterium]|nr:hypothetical protein [Candidatus Magasanikbacteria bacterium]
ELSGVSDSECLDAFNEWVDSVGQAYVDRYEEAAHVVNAFVGKEKIDFQAVKAVFGDDGVARTYLQDFAHNGFITLLPHTDGQPSEWKIDTVIDDDELATAYGSTSEKDIVDSLSDKEKDALAYIERQEFSLSSIECRFLDDGDVDVHLFFDNYTDLPDEQKALFDEEQYESVIEMFEQRLVDAYMDS